MKLEIDKLIQEYIKNPNSVENTLNLGVYYFEDNQPNKGIKYFEESLALNQGFEAEINYNLAQCYRGINKEKGKEYLEIALELNPELEDNFYMGNKRFY